MCLPRARRSRQNGAVDENLLHSKKYKLDRCPSSLCCVILRYFVAGPEVQRLTSTSKTRANFAHHLPGGIHFGTIKRTVRETLPSARRQAVWAAGNFRERRAGNIFIADFSQRRRRAAKLAGGHSQNYFSFTKRQAQSGNRKPSFDTGGNGATDEFPRRHFRHSFLGRSAATAGFWMHDVSVWRKAFAQRKTDWRISRRCGPAHTGRRSDSRRRGRDNHFRKTI